MNTSTIASTNINPSGDIFTAKPLDESSFQKLIEECLYYKDKSLQTENLAFSSQDWESLTWNTKEVFYLNSKLSRYPTLVQNFLTASDQLNFHLLVAYQKLALTWHPLLTKIERFNPTSEELQSFAFLARQSKGLVEDAAVKQHSLQTGKELFRIFSIRQWRFFSCLYRSVATILPLIEFSKPLLLQSEDADVVNNRYNEIEWHLTALRNSKFEHSVPLKERIYFNFYITYHYLTMTCHLLSQWQSPILKPY